MVKKITIKKNTKPKKTQKQQVKPSSASLKQTQKQSVTVNIGSNITKKRARPSPQKKQVKQPIASPIIYPSSTISLNQPNIKYPNPTQNPLISAITPQPKIEETKVNDLEKVRTARVEKLEVKPSESIVALKEIKKDNEKTTHALLGQILTDKQDDTEELSQLFPQPTRSKIEFVSSSTQTPIILGSSALSTLPAVVAKRELGLLRKPPTSTESLILNRSLGYNLLDLRRSQQRDILLGRGQAAEEAVEPFTQEEEESVAVEEVTPEVAAQQQNVLQQIKERGVAELVSNRPSEPTPLTQETVELGFGGLSEEPIQTSVGQFLPPEPVSQGALEVKEAKKPPKTILEPLPKQPTILEGQTAAEPIISVEQPSKKSRDQFSSMNAIDIVKYLNSQNDNIYTLRNAYDSDLNEIQEIYKNGKLIKPSVSTLKVYARNKVKESIKAEEPTILDERSGIEL